MMKNNNNNYSPPFYIFPDNKNNVVEFNKHSLNFQNFTAKLLVDGKEKDFLVEFAVPFQDFSKFINIINLDLDVIKLMKLDPRLALMKEEGKTESLNPKVTHLLKDKAAIYMFINRVTKKIYIGKTLNLETRLKTYRNVEALKKVPNSKICRDLLKFGFHNFSFTIVEHCAKEDLNIREQLYIEVFKPQYNIRKIVAKNKTKTQ